MLYPRLTNCSECASIPELLKRIDCKLAELGNSLYNNISFMLNKPIPAADILQLIAYKRILMYKNINPNYVYHYSISKIASKVILLTLGCESKLMYTPTVRVTTTTTTTPCPTTTTTSSTTSTSTSSTTTTTTTINPLAGDFSINIGSALNNSINSVSPGFYNIISGDFPVIYGEVLEGKVLSGGTTITINYSCPDGLPQLVVLKNNIVVGNDIGILQGSNLNYTYNISWLSTDDIKVTLNYAP